MTPFTKSFSLQQMKAKKTNNKAVLTTKVHPVLSIEMFFCTKNRPRARTKYTKADFKSYGIGAFCCPTKYDKIMQVP